MIIPIPDGYFTVVTYILSAILGLCVGSFLNVVIYRVPNKMNLAKPASHCPQCGYKLRFYDNIPIISYCILGGRCRSCKKHIPFRYTAVEAANMLLWIACVRRFSDNLIYMLAAMLACSLMLCVASVDLEHKIIPDRFQIALLVPATVAIFTDANTVWYDHLIGGGAAFAVFLLLALIAGKLLGREALGSGDIKLVGVLGLLLGWQKLLIMMIIASVSGSIVMLILKKRSKDGESPETPFAPFLSAGAIISLLFGDAIIKLYLGLLLG